MFRYVTLAYVMWMGALGCGADAQDSAGAGGKTMHDIDIAPQAVLSRTTSATSCTSPSDCPSGFCVDGVCCDTACTSLCQACSAAKKGSGADGTCGFIATGTDPDNECLFGNCNGSGACAKIVIGGILLGNGSACTAGSQCSSGSCTDGVCCNSACSGTCQACSAAKKGVGSDGACGNIAAATDPDNECSAGDCNGSGSCTTLAGTDPNGTSCSSGSTCLSGHCVDGVCCNSACANTCYACTAAKKGGGANGVCGFVAGGTDPDNECSFANCNGVGACGPVIKSGNGTPCSSSVECASGYCADGVCCNSSCSGTCLQCNGPSTAGSCTFVPNGQSDPNSATPCLAICNGAGFCFDNTGGNCTSGSECPSHICNDLICEAPKPANGPLMWLTLRNGGVIAQGEGPYVPHLSLTQIASKLTPGSDIAVNGKVSRLYPNTPEMFFHHALYGGFTAAGEPLLTSGNGRYTPYGTFTRTLYRGGFDRTYADFGIQANEGCWPVYCQTFGWSFVAAGANDAGQKGAIVEHNTSGDIFGIEGFEVGDGIKMFYTTVLVRYSNDNAVEFKKILTQESDLTDPMVLGPAGEFYSMSGNAAGLWVYKYDAMGEFEWNVMTNGGAESHAFDIDASGNVLIGFAFTGSIDFGSGPMTASSTKDLGLVKLDPWGKVVWQKHFAGDVSDVHLVRAGAEDFAILVKRGSAMDLGTGAITGGMVLAKFDSAGSALWHANLDGLGTLTLSADLAGSVYVGTSSPTADFGWGTPMSYMTVAIAMAKYGTCTGAGGCKLRNAACSADTECASGACVSGACF